MGIKAETILEKIKKDETDKLKSILVEKDIDVEYDLGNLLALDTNVSDTHQLKNNPDEYLRSLARGNTQLLFNEVWKLPIERNQEAILAKLPAPQTVLPREKPAPKAKPPTKWEEYAKLKGIKKKKRDRMTFDDKSQSWRPRYGYKRANDPTKEWVLDVPKNAGPTEDMFAKKLDEKSERVAKNELQRLRNIARRTGKKVPGVGLLSTDAKQPPSIPELKQSFHLAKKATASLGRFEEKLKDEKPQKNRGKKQRFDPLISVGTSEKDRQLKILNQMYKKTPAINVAQATSRELKESQSSFAGKSKKKQGKRSKQGGRNKFAKSKGSRR